MSYYCKNVLLGKVVRKGLALELFKVTQWGPALGGKPLRQKACPSAEYTGVSVLTQVRRYFLELLPETWVMLSLLKGLVLENV